MEKRETRKVNPFLLKIYRPALQCNDGESKMDEFLFAIKIFCFSLHYHCFCMYLHTNTRTLNNTDVCWCFIFYKKNDESKKIHSCSLILIYDRSSCSLSCLHFQPTLSKPYCKWTKTSSFLANRWISIWIGLNGIQKNLHVNMAFIFSLLSFPFIHFGWTNVGGFRL
jgi:hypothetical protein